MAGHSKFKNIMYRKGAQDAKRAKVFTKLIRELTVAARNGADPDGNPRLNTAIAAAKAANLPKDTMVRAIKRGSSPSEGGNFEEIRYEGYGPGGVAIIIETLTDNRNRTARELRNAFTTAGGSLGETNSVSFQFERVGAIGYPAAAASADEMFEAALDAGAADVETTGEGHEVTCAPDDLNGVREALAAAFGPPVRAQFEWRPQNTIEIADDKIETLFKLLEALDDNDDVQSVSANFEVADETMSKLTA